MKREGLFSKLRKEITLNNKKKNTYPDGFILAQKKARTPREKYNMNFRLSAEPNKKQYP